MRAFLFISLIAACSPYDPDLGASPFLCGKEEPKCPDGYTCNGTACVNGSGGGSGQVDAPKTSGFQCDDDSATEGPSKNDSTGTAWQTPVATNKTTFPLAGLAICPAGDKDNYSVTIVTEGQNLQADITYQDDGAPLQVIILNSSGSPISSSSPNGADMATTKVPNLPTGTYYVQVAVAPGTTLVENNYKITFTVTGP